MTIQGIMEKLNNIKEDLEIKISDETYLTKKFGSDRGEYEDMYIGHTDDSLNIETIHTVKELKELLDKALKIGVMRGYKGGEYVIDEYTQVTIGMYGCSGDNIDDIRVIDNVCYVVYGRYIYQEVWK